MFLCVAVIVVNAVLIRENGSSDGCGLCGGGCLSNRLFAFVDARFLFVRAVNVVVVFMRFAAVRVVFVFVTCCAAFADTKLDLRFRACC